jgi:hypothetical protein
MPGARAIDFLRIGPRVVIPAQAGIQNPSVSKARWMPAFAGMT